LTFEFLLNPGRGRLIRTAGIENRDDAFLSEVHILPAIKCNQSIAHLSGLGRGEECSHNFLERCLVRAGEKKPRLPLLQKQFLKRCEFAEDWFLNSGWQLAQKTFEPLDDVEE